MNNTEYFQEYRKKVEKWATVRCIYDQSTEAKQQAKALTEVNEYILAENTDKEIDAIGDITVCVVNAYKLADRAVDLIPNLDRLVLDDYRDTTIGDITKEILDGNYYSAIKYIAGFCYHNEFDFQVCLDMAWKDIKDRRGMMIDGFFVKWENLTEEQRIEVAARESCPDIEGFENGYLGEDFEPMKCRKCEGVEFEDTVKGTEGGHVSEVERSCKKCGHICGYWAYGAWER